MFRHRQHSSNSDLAPMICTRKFITLEMPLTAHVCAHNIGLHSIAACCGSGTDKQTTFQASNQPACSTDQHNTQCCWTPSADNSACILASCTKQHSAQHQPRHCGRCAWYIAQQNTEPFTCTGWRLGMYCKDCCCWSRAQTLT